MNKLTEVDKSCWNCKCIYCDDYGSDCDKHGAYRNLVNFPFYKTTCKDWEPDTVHIIKDGKIYLSDKLSKEQQELEYLNTCWG